MQIPRYSTALYGRDALVDRVLPTLTEPGITTLWGQGGVGKTRVATELVSRCRRERQEVVFLSVHEDARAEGLLRRVLHAADIPVEFRSDLEVPERLGRWFADRGVPLVVFDEAELALTEVAEAARALAAGADLHLLATSRTALAVQDERIVRVEPLQAEHAAQVFRGAAPRGVAWDEERAAWVVEQLEGLPLALELAAGRLDVLPMRVLADRLYDPLPLLRDPSNVDKHGALQRSIAASWQSLPQWTRDQLASCLAFASHFSLEAAEGVLPVSAEGSVLDGLQLLARRSLIRPVEDAVTVRFQLAAFVRQFLRAEVPVAAEVCRRHLAWFGARGMEELLAKRTRERERDWLVIEEADVALALRRGLEGLAEDPLALSRCGAVLMASALPLEQRVRLSEQLESLDPADVDPRAMAKIEVVRASFANRRGDLGGSIPHLERARSWAQKGEHPLIEATVVGLLGNRLSNLGHESAAQDAYRTSLELALLAGDPDAEGRAGVALTLSEDWLQSWNPQRSLQRLASLRQAPTSSHSIDILNRIAMLRLALGQTDQAIDVLDSLDLDLGHWLGRAAVDSHLIRGHVQMLEDDLDGADATFARGAELSEHNGLIMELAMFGLASALGFLRRGQPERVEAKLASAMQVFHDGPWDWAEYAVVGEGIRMWAAALLQDDGSLAAARSRLDRLMEDDVSEPVYRCVPTLLDAVLPTLVQLRALETGEEAGPDPDRAARLATIRALQPTYALFLIDLKDQALAAFERLAALDAAWVAYEDGGFCAPLAAPVDLRRRKSAGLILRALVEAHLAAPGSGCTVEALVDAGWPGQTLVAGAGRNRLYVALNTLRKAGMTVIERVEEGYGIDAGVVFRWGGSFPPKV